MYRSLCVVFLFFPLNAFSAVDNETPWSLLQSIDCALTGSDRARELEDQLVLAQMDIAAAEHQFQTKIVPLTSFGFTQGMGSQKLGLEFQKETSLGTSVSYGVVGNRLDDNGGYVVQNNTSAAAYVRVTQGLFRRWGKKYNLADLNKAELRSVEDGILVERERQKLIQAAVQKYYDLVLANQLLDLSGQACERSREHLKSAVSRQQVGLVSKVDVYRAELAVLDAESGYEKQLRVRQRAEDSYRELLGIVPDTKVVVAKDIVKMSPVVPEGWEDTVWKTRLDWQAHRVKMKINDLEIFKAERELEPDAGLTATVEQKGEGNDVRDALNMDETNWSLQFELLSSLDNFTENNALVRRKMEQNKLRRDEAALQRRVIREAKDSFLDLLFAEKTHFINVKRLGQAEMALDFARTQYEKGVSNNLDVLDAEAAYSRAKVDIARALVSYNLAAISFACNLGVLDRDWVRLSLQPVIEGDVIK